MSSAGFGEKARQMQRFPPIFLPFTKTNDKVETQQER